MDNKFNDYFNYNIRISLIKEGILFIFTKEGMFYCIDIKNENVPPFFINNGNSVKDSVII
jgi:hypothetical protein